MKTLLPLLLGATAIIASAVNLHSQTPGLAKTPIQQLQALKAKNQELIDRQTKTLKALDDLATEAQQAKTFAKRT